MKPLMQLIPLALLSSTVLAQQPKPLPCMPTEQRGAWSVQGEVYGQQTFSAPVNALWRFRLEPSRFGWEVRVRDQKGMDLSQITPPFRFAPNPREIYGWHFRNSDNSAPNQGEVNAPQHLRLFQFSPSLSGTGGYRPPDREMSVSEVSLRQDHGRGALTLLDLGLADLAPDQKARVNYLKFQACLTWPKQLAPSPEGQSPTYLDEEAEIMYACGLDSDKYALSAWVLPRWTGGDLDADGVNDQVAPIIRKADARRGVAICQAGTRLSLIGYEADDQAPLTTKTGEPRTETYLSLAEFFESTEYWQIRKNKRGVDELILGRQEKAELAVFWDGEQFDHELLWVFVEP